MAVRTLQVDRKTADVVRALEAAGVASILLKGPSVEHWLGDNLARAYGDTDLLVPRKSFVEAERTLGRFGFTCLRDTNPFDAVERGLYHARKWKRPDGAVVDLHCTVPGVGVTPEKLWEILRDETATLRVGGAEVDVLGRVATAVQLALHAAVHGAKKAKPLGELQRALDRFDRSTWSAARALAERLNAIPAFATGLRLLPAGCRLADQLKLPRERSVEVALRATSPPRGALAFEQLARTRGVRPLAATVLRRLFPPPSFMRNRFPLASRGPVGLLAAYVARLLSMPAMFGPAFRAWARARRQVRLPDRTV